LKRSDSDKKAVAGAAPGKELEWFGEVLHRYASQLLRHVQDD
jgi:hypothetical protein